VKIARLRAVVLTQYQRLTDEQTVLRSTKLFYADAREKTQNDTELCRKAANVVNVYNVNCGDALQILMNGKLPPSTPKKLPYRPNLFIHPVSL